MIGREEDEDDRLEYDLEDRVNREEYLDDEVMDDYNERGNDLKKEAAR